MPYSIIGHRASNTFLVLVIILCICRPNGYITHYYNKYNNIMIGGATTRRRRRRRW